MPATEADLHAHTTASDGTETAGRVVARGAAAGLLVLAITDHDTVAGVAPAVAAAGAAGSPRVVPGVELSSRHRGGDVHVLGYFVPYEDAPFLAGLAARRADRLTAVAESVRRLRALGVPITLEDVQREAAGEAVGRPHVARAMVRAGVVQHVDEAFSPRYIGNGGAAHVPSRPEPPLEAVRFLRACGAAPVVAHPGAFREGPELCEADLRPLVAAGLVGLEVNHPAHDFGRRIALLRLADTLGLVVTGGSDWHGPRAGRMGEAAVEPGHEGVGVAAVTALAARVGRRWP